MGKYTFTELTFVVTSVNQEIILIAPVTIIFPYIYCLLYHYETFDS